MALFENIPPCGLGVANAVCGLTAVPTGLAGFGADAPTGETGFVAVAVTFPAGCGWVALAFLENMLACGFGATDADCGLTVLAPKGFIGFRAGAPTGETGFAAVAFTTGCSWPVVALFGNILPCAFRVVGAAFNLAVFAAPTGFVGFGGGVPNPATDFFGAAAGGIPGFAGGLTTAGFGLAAMFSPGAIGFVPTGANVFVTPTVVDFVAAAPIADGGFGVFVPTEFFGLGAGTPTDETGFAVVAAGCGWATLALFENMLPCGFGAAEAACGLTAFALAGLIGFIAGEASRPA